MQKKDRRMGVPSGGLGSAGTAEGGDAERCSRVSAHPHRYEQPRLTTLYEQRNVVLRLLNRVAKIGDARYRGSVGGEDNIALLESGVSRGAASLFHEQATLCVGLMLLLARQGSHREAQLAAGLRVIGVGGSALVLHLGELDAHFAGGVLSPDFELHARSRREAGNHGGQLVGL